MKIIVGEWMQSAAFHAKIQCRIFDWRGDAISVSVIQFQSLGYISSNNTSALRRTWCSCHSEWASRLELQE